MKRPIVLSLVLLLGGPAFARELMTRNKTPVRETPDKAAKVVGTLPRNLRVPSDARKDFWFHVSAEVDGKRITGWVFQADVETVMGRSKGQLIAENDRLYAELTELRRKLKKGRTQLKEALEEIRHLKDALDKARAEIERLKAALGKTGTGGQ